MSPIAPTPDEPAILAPTPTPTRRVGAVVSPNNPRIAPYLDAARSALRDLPPAEQTELLADLDAHLHEILAEEADTFESRLGPAAAYATEFRASAGYPGAEPRPAVGLKSIPKRVLQRLRAIRRDVAGLVRTLPGGPATVSVLRRMRPAWWVFRGWVVAYLIVGDALLSSFGFGGKRPFAAMVVCIGVSVAWGLRADRRAALPLVERVLLLGVNTATVLIILNAISGGGPLANVGAGGESFSVYAPESVPGLALDGEPVTNLVAYDLAGQPIDAIQLFDQDGRPVTVAEGGTDRFAVPVAAPDGEPVANVFPIRRIEIGRIDPLTCDAVPCDPSAMGKVARQDPIPLGSAWKGLTQTPVPAMGTSIPLNELMQPIWPSLQPAPSPQAPAAPPTEPQPAPAPEPPAVPAP